MQEATADQEVKEGTAYDSVWAGQGVPTQEPSVVEAVLLKEDKLYTVLAVVLIIWFGIMLFIVRTDRKLDRLEKSERST
ncbi:MAG: hypothetical protein HKN13_05400 [Rhodothermales bacterium]|nr:hypothetical protein [Rhodothermales bacterium]